MSKQRRVHFHKVLLSNFCLRLPHVSRRRLAKSLPTSKRRTGSSGSRRDLSDPGAASGDSDDEEDEDGPPSSVGERGKWGVGALIGLLDDIVRMWHVKERELEMEQERDARC